MTIAPSPLAFASPRRCGWYWVRWGLAFSFSFLAGFTPWVGHAQPLPPPALDADALRSRYAAMAPRLANNDFGRPLVLVSEQTHNRVEGVADAVVDAPFEVVSQTFSSPQDWCGILLLHLNTRRCQVRQEPRDSPTPTVLSIQVGKKTTRGANDSPAETFSLDLRMDTPIQKPGWLSAQLAAPDGPVGTRDYRISVQAIPLGPSKTLVHFRYAYAYGLAARLAMQAYLSTFGSKKIGFSMESAKPGQPPRPIGGMRGAIERNTMRYLLAIEVYLQTRDVPADRRLERRLQAWFDATEQYRDQLYEIDRDTYFILKQRDFRTRKE